MEKLKQVTVRITVKDGTEYGAVTLSEVSSSQTLGGHELGVGPVDELISFVDSVVDSVAMRVASELRAQDHLASVRRENTELRPVS